MFKTQLFWKESSCGMHISLYLPEQNELPNSKVWWIFGCSRPIDYFLFTESYVKFNSSQILLALIIQGVT